mgnify:CR=1 FL=1
MYIMMNIPVRFPFIKEKRQNIKSAWGLYFTVKCNPFLIWSERYVVPDEQ